VKKCASCTKDLPDAALHCVFCGAKQPPAPAVQQGLAKTAFGYSANEMLDQIRQQGAPQARNAPQPPARAVPTPQPQPPQPPPPPGYNQPPYNPPRPAPMQPMPPAMQPMPQPPPQPGPRPPPPGPHFGGPQGGFVPHSPAAAPTMFVQSGPQPPQPAMLQSPGPPGPPGYGRPPSAASMQPTFVPPPSQPPTQISPGPAQPQVPIMRIPVPQPQPYYGSQPGAHMSRPIEPWRDSIRLMMFVWGVALLVAFATPLRITPDLLFNWKLVLDGQGTARLPPLMLAAVGLLSVIVASIPMQQTPRGLIAALLGLAGIAVPIALVGTPPWQALCSMIGALVLVPSLLVRHEYRHAALPRILVTVGALGILLPFLLPQGGAIPLVAVFKGLFDRPGLEKVQPALALGLIVIVVMSLLAWLPAPVSGGAKVWAWLVILWALIVHVTLLLVGGNLGDVVKASPSAALVPWIAGGAAFSLGSAYLALVGYGLASVLGKQLE
jgi:hypothetical protein